MALPSRPVRKSASVGNTPIGQPKSSNVPGSASYVKKPATVAQASKATYVRKSAGVSPQTQNTGRTAGDAAQPHGSTNKKWTPQPRNGQPFNNKKGQNMSSSMKGVD